MSKANPTVSEMKKENIRQPIAVKSGLQGYDEGYDA